MTDDNRVTPEPTRLRILMARARRAGYQLIAEATDPSRWVLVDSEDGERLFEATTLGEVEQYLNE
ncbi:hypothetical protein [Nocardia cyriacigeorgica]|uniref:hypothetical protein n=1 Tax=Nocardia cyriacigeorgica TaxID=135487 RepID=UPI001893A587|nr:hypothetical protein [Nocardia cyriacigeorgica]MBF6455538.1 hypothetical protein [Nocardia cyriacigeorgica]MBF6479883.1 hypothetical protein [Nocardia cyriacigeorgica]MBF6553720.1 hypothetical protein [Nocardia cyriacigeorgica]